MNTKKTIPFCLTSNITQNPPLVQEVFLVEDKKYIPQVDRVCSLHQTKSRTIKVAHVEGPKQITYHYGTYKYRDELSGKYKFVTESLPHVTGKKRHDNSTILKACEPVLRNEMTMSYAAYQGRTLLNLTTVPSTIWRWIGVLDINQDSYGSMEEQVLEHHSGHGSVDEVYDNGDGIVIITDPVSNTILSADLLDHSPTNEDITSIFSKLWAKGFRLNQCTRDGSGLYVKTIRLVYPFILLQICIFHLIKGIIKSFSRWQKRIRNQVNVSALKKSLPHGDKHFGMSIKQYLFRRRGLFLKKQLSRKERQQVKGIIESFPDFGRLRYIYLRFLRIFNALTLSEAVTRLWDFLSEPLVGEKLPEVQKQLLKYYNRGELFTYLAFDAEIHSKIRTSNHTERVNRKFRKKQKTHYRIRKTKRREKMLRFMIYFHNMDALGKEVTVVVIIFLASDYLVCFFGFR